MADQPENRETRDLSEEADSIWRIAASPLIWAAHFVFSYGATSLVCVRLAERDLTGALRVGIAIATVLAVLGILWVGHRAWKQWDYLTDQDYRHANSTDEDRHEFLGHASFLLAIISLIGVLYVALPVLVIQGCT